MKNKTCLEIEYDKVKYVLVLLVSNAIVWLRFVDFYDVGSSCSVFDSKLVE
jgi:hypothetical protein